MAGRGTGAATWGSIGAWLTWLGGFGIAVSGTGGGGGNMVEPAPTGWSSVVFTTVSSVRRGRTLSVSAQRARTLAVMGATWVVIGAGSAGCVAAARLSEDPDCDVILIEGGPDLSRWDIPAEIDGPNFLDAASLHGRSYPELRARRVAGGVASPYLRGRGVGGSSTINAMVALRGNAEQYRSWGWDDTEAAWAAMALPEEHPEPGELGPVDIALLAACSDARPVPLTRRDGRRITSAEAYLWPAAERSNLTVMTESPVDRVRLDGRRATGVVLADGEVVAGDRVVLAAGALHDPAILLRSGVDTRGVGDGLQDHPSVPLTLALRDGVVQDLGGLVIGSLCERSGLQFLPMNHLGPGAVGYGVLSVALMTPQGRAGSVRLAGHDPHLDPVVEFALLDDGRDVEALLAGVEQACAILRSDAFADIVETVYIDDHGTTIGALDDGADRVAWLRSVVGDYVHASGTCAMGSVVDGDGRLIGYDDVLVCDASVFPSIPDVNTHLPTTMLAERLTRRWRAPGAPPMPASP